MSKNCHVGVLKILTNARLSKIDFLFKCNFTFVSLRNQLFLKVGGIESNVFGLCVRAGFGAQNCQPALHLNRSRKLQVCTACPVRYETGLPRLTQNPCYKPFFYLSFMSISSKINSVKVLTSLSIVPFI